MAGLHGLNAFIATHDGTIGDPMERLAGSAAAKRQPIALIVDGPDLMTQLLRGTDAARGGDYATFTARVHTFFGLLRRAGFVPEAVVLDGVRRDGLKVAVEAADEAVRAAGLDSTFGSQMGDGRDQTSQRGLAGFDFSTPARGADKDRKRSDLRRSRPEWRLAQVLPPLLERAFAQVCVAMGLRVKRCDGDVAPCVAALARARRAVVLGDSSDYYILATHGFLPLTKLRLSRDGAQGRLYTPRELMAVLFKGAGGGGGGAGDEAAAPHVMPLFAALLGGNLVSPTALARLHARISTAADGSALGDKSRRVVATAQWVRRLARFTLDQALTDVACMLADGESRLLAGDVAATRGGGRGRGRGRGRGPGVASATMSHVSNPKAATAGGAAAGAGNGLVGGAGAASAGLGVNRADVADTVARVRATVAYFTPAPPGPDGAVPMPASIVDVSSFYQSPSLHGPVPAPLSHGYRNLGIDAAVMALMVSDRRDWAAPPVVASAVGREDPRQEAASLAGRPLRQIWVSMVLRTQDALARRRFADGSACVRWDAWDGLEDPAVAAALAMAGAPAAGGGGGGGGGFGMGGRSAIESAILGPSALVAPAAASRLPVNPVTGAPAAALDFRYFPRPCVGDLVDTYAGPGVVVGEARRPRPGDANGGADEHAAFAGGLGGGVGGGVGGGGAAAVAADGAMAARGASGSGSGSGSGAADLKVGGGLDDTMPTGVPNDIASAGRSASASGADADGSAAAAAALEHISDEDLVLLVRLTDMTLLRLTAPFSRVVRVAAFVDRVPARGLLRYDAVPIATHTLRLPAAAPAGAGATGGGAAAAASDILEVPIPSLLDVGGRGLAYMHAMLGVSMTTLTALRPAVWRLPAAALHFWARNWLDASTVAVACAVVVACGAGCSAREQAEDGGTGEVDAKADAPLKGDAAGATATGGAAGGGGASPVAPAPAVGDRFGPGTGGVLADLVAAAPAMDGAEDDETCPPFKGRLSGGLWVSPVDRAAAHRSHEWQNVLLEAARLNQLLRLPVPDLFPRAVYDGHLYHRWSKLAALNTRTRRPRAAAPAGGAGGGAAAAPPAPAPAPRSSSGVRLVGGGGDYAPPEPADKADAPEVAPSPAGGGDATGAADEGYGGDAGFDGTAPFTATTYMGEVLQELAQVLGETARNPTALEQYRTLYAAVTDGLDEGVLAGRVVEGFAPEARETRPRGAARGTAAQGSAFAAAFGDSSDEDEEEEEEAEAEGVRVKGGAGGGGGDGEDSDSGSDHDGYRKAPSAFGERPAPASAWPVTGQRF